jgi:hypothetical protein
MITPKNTYPKLHETMVRVEWLPLAIASCLVNPLIAPRAQFPAKKHTYKT